MDIFIPFIMYWWRLFLLFTGKQNCLHSYFFGEPTCNGYLSSCKNAKFGCVTVLGVQLFSKIRQNKKTKNLVSPYFPHALSKHMYCLVNL